MVNGQRARMLDDFALFFAHDRFQQAAADAPLAGSHSGTGLHFDLLRGAGTVLNDRINLMAADLFTAADQIAAFIHN